MNNEKYVYNEMAWRTIRELENKIEEAKHVTSGNLRVLLELDARHSPDMFGRSRGIYIYYDEHDWAPWCVGLKLDDQHVHVNSIDEGIALLTEIRQKEIEQ